MLDGCYRGTTAETPAFLRPSVERVELGRTFGMALVNRSDGNAFFGPSYWTVWREEGGKWRNVDPRDGVEFEPGPYCFGLRDVTLSGGEDAEKGTLGALFEVCDRTRYRRGSVGERVTRLRPA